MDDRRKRNEDFWCQLSRDDDTTHGATQNSPAFETQEELWEWVRANRKPGDEVYTYRRQTKIGSGSFTDVPLSARDEDDHDVDPAKVRELVAKLSETLRLKAAERRMPAPGERSVQNVDAARQRGVEARTRLEHAGAELRERKDLE